MNVAGAAEGLLGQEGALEQGVEAVGRPFAVQEYAGGEIMAHRSRRRNGIGLNW